MHCFHVGYVGVEMNVYYNELADFVLGWAGLDICADDNRKAQPAPPPALGPNEDPLIGPANPPSPAKLLPPNPPKESPKLAPKDPPKEHPVKPVRPPAKGLVRPDTSPVAPEHVQP